MQTLTQDRQALDHLVDHARRRGPAWYPELDADRTAVRVERHVRRRRTVIAVLRLSDGSTLRRVALKQSRPEGRDLDFEAGPQGRPTVIPAAAPGELARAWFRGLVLARDHFSLLGNPRLDAVRPLDLVEGSGTVFMEYVDQPTLRSRMIHETRRGRSAMPELLERAGLWLREFHAAGQAEPAPPRCPTRQDYVLAIEAFCSYLAELVDDRELFREVSTAVERTADSLLPSRMPLELAHGDYAPRNLFVGHDGRLIGFDATPRVRGPACEDVARFLVAMRFGGLQVLSFGRAVSARRLDQLEARFLAGYYGASDPPMGGIRSFELLVLLNRLSAVLTRRDGAAIGQRLRRAVRSRLVYLRFRSEVLRLLDSLSEAAAGRA